MIFSPLNFESTESAGDLNLSAFGFILPLINIRQLPNFMYVCTLIYKIPTNIITFVIYHFKIIIHNIKFSKDQIKLP